MRLYDYILSGNAYKARLIFALLGVEYEAVAVDFYPGNEHKTPKFLDLNPAGTLPVLTDDNLTLTDSSAILSYIALKHDGSGNWFPVGDPNLGAQVVHWLNFADQLTSTIGIARLHDMLGRPAHIQKARVDGHKALRRLESHLTEREFDGASFLVGDNPTIADIACFPYTALAGDGGISLMAYPAIGRWLISVRSLTGFVEMPGIHPMHGSENEPDLSKQGAVSKQ